jgi:riboflavin kinase/FMN adenylyltransferase
MKSLLYRDVTSDSDKIVVTIGNFDGMHLGHKSLFQELVKMAKEEIAVPTLVSFYPHPKFFFAEKRGLTLNPEDGFLSSPRQKLAQANAVGIERLVLLHFSDALSQLTPLEFFDQKIMPLGKLRGVVVGRDWCFGRDKAGNIETLAELGKKYNFRVKILEDESVNGQRVSSSLIRNTIAKGDVALASKYLGYNFSLSGHVKKGDQRGRLLGFPTMNLLFKNDLLPSYGVYKTSTIVRGKSLPSITNVGIRPTFSGSKPVVETHILEGFSGENYGERVEVAFIDRIRSEKKFANIEELKSQIEKDIAIAKQGHLGQ